MEASAQKKAEIYLIEFPSVSTPEQKPLSKATIELCVSWGLQGDFSPASSPQTARAVFPEAAETGDLLREKGLL